MKNPASSVPGRLTPPHTSHHRNRDPLLEAPATTTLPGALLAIALAALLLPLSASAIIDILPPGNPAGDGLDDVWQEIFNAQTVLPGDDEDGDGKTNLEECLAGTDPFDGTDCLDAKPGDLDTYSASVTFPSKAGKLYQVYTSRDLTGWTAVGPQVHGNDAEITIDLATAQATEVSGNITHELYMAITGEDLASLTGNPKYPFLPDGTRALGRLEIPANVDNDYGGRIRGFVKPPVSGSYTFAIASRHDGELWLSTNDDPANITKIAHAGGPGESSALIQPREWDRFASQTSAPVSLVAGQKYYIEVRHKHGGEEDHCSVAWDVPDAGFPAGLFLVDGEYLCPWSQQNASLTGIPNELWFDIPGDDVASLAGDPKYPDTPELFRTLDDLEIPVNTTDNYGGRIRGFLLPPGSGDYEIFLNSRHHSELWLSTDANPANKVLRASVTSGNRVPGVWSYAAGHRFIVNLRAGRRYYFEVLHKHGTGGDHCQVGWDIPSSSFPPGIAVIEGQFVDPPTDGPTPGDLTPGDPAFYRVSVEDLDQDDDGLSDWAEEQMAGEDNFSPFDSNSTLSGFDDLTTVTNALGATGETVEFLVLDDVATEDARTGYQVQNEDPVSAAPRDVARVLVKRTGGLQPVTVQFTISGVPLPDESADGSDDYDIEDRDGEELTSAVTVGFGQVSNHIVFVPKDDSGTATGAEFPEKLECNLVDAGGPGAGDYDVTGVTSAQITFHDALDIPEHETLFVGRFGQDANAVLNTAGNGFVSGKLNGPKNQMEIWNQFSSLTSPQEDSHVHKSTGVDSPGPILHEITNVPGDTDSGILLGELGGYIWPITLEGGLTAQRVIDSLFLQNGETPLYLNVHTNDNADGEIWAFFNKVTGSIAPPDPPTPAEIGYPLAILSGNDLEREVWRFLDQATFGARQAEVDTLVANIESQRSGGNPNYSRIEEFENWIDTQMAMDQTWLLDFTLAADFMEWKLRGYYDPTDYQSYVLSPGNANQIRTINTPVEPGSYPVIDRSNPNPELWIPNGPYPLGPDEINVGQNNNYNGLGDVDDNNRRRGLFTLMLNAHDQLRQKMGYALQQINVVSEELSFISTYHYGAANYQDQLNAHAFGKYRDLIDWVVWSPQMGNYLSSYRNQRTIYDDNDTPSDPSDDIALFAPDENLAREVMQLFTIGLFELFLNGDIRLSEENGLPSATYDNDNITELARILTGQGYSYYSYDPDPGSNNEKTQNTANEENDTWHAPLENTSFTRGAGNQYVGWGPLRRMKMFPDNHDTGYDHFTGDADPYDIAGGRSINNIAIGDSSLRAAKNVSDALDWLAGVVDGNTANDFTGDAGNPASSHNSTPAFIANLLIQRFVTSNPSGDYIYHVAKAFAHGFDRDFDGVVDVPGGEGDLGAAIKTILLHPEARNLDNVLSDRFGKKLTALEAELKLIRTMEAHTHMQIEDRADPGYAEPIAGDYPDAAEFTSYNYPAGQADNFEMDCWFRFPDTDALSESNEASLTISPFKEETVFSFQLPDYAPSDVALFGLYGPELMLVTELTSIQNINYFETICRNYPNGHGLQNRIDRIGAFASPFNSNNNDNVRIPFDLWLDRTNVGGRQLYPRSAELGTNNELTKDTEFLRRLDMMLMAGSLNARYDYNRGDDNANGPGDPGPNPREAILDLVRLANLNPSGNTPNTDDRARVKMMDALWAIVQSADFQIRK